jgi:hypothetical protein
VRSVEETVATLYQGQRCAACGAAPTPDEPCGNCRAIPAVTGPQFCAELHAHPLGVAEVEALQAEAAGWEMLDAAISRFHAADRIRHMAKLEIARNDAQAAADRHKRAHDALVAGRELAAARRAARKAARELETAEADYAEVARAEEEARTYSRPLTVQTQALIQLNAASEVLGRFRAADTAAKAAVAPKDAAVERSEKTGKRLKTELQKAQAALASPGRIGYGTLALSAGLNRLLSGGNLNAEEKLAAGEIGWMICTVTGVTDALEADVRHRIETEKQEAARNRPIVFDGAGVARANPLNPATPQPYHPALPLPAGATVTAPPVTGVTPGFS